MATRFEQSQLAPSVRDKARHNDIFGDSGKPFQQGFVLLAPGMSLGKGADMASPAVDAKEQDDCSNCIKCSANRSWTLRTASLRPRL
jgi:hypothetical protein